MLVGAIFFHLYAPRSLATYPLFAVSVLLGVLVSFGCRFMVNAAAYWLLDVRGVNTFWTFATVGLAGLAFPLHFLPSWLTWTLWVATPFPSVLQAPLDVLVERGGLADRLGLVAGQAVWAIAVLALAAFGAAAGRAEAGDPGWLRPTLRRGPVAVRSTGGWSGPRSAARPSTAHRS